MIPYLTAQSQACRLTNLCVVVQRQSLDTKTSVSQSQYTETNPTSIEWCPEQGSNSQSPDQKSGALPTEP